MLSSVEGLIPNQRKELEKFTKDVAYFSLVVQVTYHPDCISSYFPLL